jgi:diguanylate cyclase (GGDEF)-like protein
MAAQLRPAEIAARYGGEEFAILMPDCTHGAALSVGGRLRAAISRKRLEHGAPQCGAYVTLSIGVAVARSEEISRSE